MDEDLEGGPDMEGQEQMAGEGEMEEEETVSELEDTNCFLHEEEFEEEPVTRQTLLTKIDNDILSFLLAYLKTNKYITRKKLLEKYQDLLSTESILNNLPTLDVAGIRGDRMQRRLQKVMQEAQLDKEIVFSFLSNKSGYLIHHVDFDFKKEVFRLQDEAIYEHLDSTEATTLPGILNQYKNLGSAIFESGQNIDAYYRKQKKILDEFDINKLFSLIKPEVFNFVALTTMSVREANTILKHPNLQLWLEGKEYLLETYNPSKPNSQRLFSKRVFLSLGRIHDKN